MKPSFGQRREAPAALANPKRQGLGQGLQVPSWQVLPSAQTLPQAPQFAGSVSRSLQVPKQGTRAAGQPHTPSVQADAPSFMIVPSE